MKFLATLLAFAACLAGSVGTAQAQSLVTDPASPVAQYGFWVSVTAMFTGGGGSVEVHSLGSQIVVYLNHSCASPCPAPTMRTRTFYLQALPPGSYTLMVYQGRSTDSASPVAQAPVTVAATNVAEVGTQPSPLAAFVPFRLSVTAMFPALMFTQPEVEVRDNAITVYLNGDCGFLCPTPGRRTIDFDVRALPPGDYELTVYPWSRAWHHAFPAAMPAVSRLTIASGANYQGLWWRSPAGTEPGWGLQIAHQGETLFATWFTYDADGSPTWLVVPSGARTGPGAYSGALYRVRSLPSSSEVSLAASSDTTLAGGAWFTFDDGDNGTFTYQLNGATRSIPITRQIFSTPVSRCASGMARGSSNYQDLWWNAPEGSEPGWGVQIAHQGDILFATIFAYDNAGKATWLVMSDGRRAVPGTYVGTLYRTRGPAFDADPYRPEAVSVAAVGQGTFTFPDALRGTFAYTLDVAPSAGRSKAITRQIFSPFTTACN